MHSLRARIGPLVALAVLVPALAVTAPTVLRGTGGDSRFDVLYVPSGRSLAVLSPPLRLTLANAYWLAIVQYVGDQSMRAGAQDKLFPLADLVTDLDPGHGYAYQTAGIVLSAARRLDESDRILKKGMERGPNWWSYPFYLAFNAFFYRQDYEAAAHWAEVAARTPGASPNISQLALALKVKSGDPDDAVRFLEEMRSVSKDEKTSQAIEEQYRLALLQRDFAALDRALEAYRGRTRRAPRSLDELVAAGDLSRVPEEPFGGRYVLGDDGRVHSTVRDFRFKPAEKNSNAPWLVPQLAPSSP